MVDPVWSRSGIQLYHGDCLEVLRTLPDASVDAVVTDPPYPCIERDYGYWTEAEWFALMNPVVEQCRRVLRSTGSAMFVLQPNSERVGRMRTWLWDFMAKWGREWGMVQDVWWWNYRTLPEAHAIQGKLMRPSLKACVWLGQPNCYRDQDSVLWAESQDTKMRMIAERASGIDRGRQKQPSGHGCNMSTIGNAAIQRGGVTPYNVLPLHHGQSQESAGGHGHGAGTPLPLCRWWVRYICPPGGTVLDPFVGSGTTLLAARQEGRIGIGIEREANYIEIIKKRLKKGKEIEPDLPEGKSNGFYSTIKLAKKTDDRE